MTRRFSFPGVCDSCSQETYVTCSLQPGCNGHEEACPGNHYCVKEARSWFIRYAVPHSLYGGQRFIYGTHISTPHQSCAEAYAEHIGEAGAKVEPCVNFWNCTHSHEQLGHQGYEVV